MSLDTPTLMMIFFILFLVVSIWKIYAFLPNKQLEDDDRTEASQEELLKIIKDVIAKNKENLSTKELFEQITNDENFDKEHYWRFNQNRLNQLLIKIYEKN